MYEVIVEETVKRKVTYRVNCEDWNATDAEIREEIEEMVIDGNLEPCSIIEIQEDDEQVVISSSLVEIINEYQLERERENKQYREAVKGAKREEAEENGWDDEDDEDDEEGL